MSKNIRKLILKLVFGLSLFVHCAEAQDQDDLLLKKESRFDGIYDYAYLLSKKEADFLSKKLIRYSDTTSTQIAIAIIESLNGNEIAMLATEKAQEWQIGQEKKDNGVFILIAKKERKIHITTGYGIEHLITDFLSKRIINEIIVPNFQKQQYFIGLNSSIDVIIQSLSGTYKSDTKKAKSNKIVPLFVLGLIIVIFIILMNNKTRNGKDDHHGNKLSSSDIITTILLASLGSRVAHRGGGFGGGGFGGGGFGGGGASGHW